MTFLFSLLRPHGLTLTLMGGLSLLLFNPPIASHAADLAEIPESVTQSSPLPERKQFQPIPLQPTSPFWQFSNAITVTGPSHLVQQFYTQTLTPQQLGEGDSGCFLSQSATIQRRTPQSVAVILTQMGSCDDSLSGQQTRVDFSVQGDAQGDQWQVDWVGQRNHCRGKFWVNPGQPCP